MASRRRWGGGSIRGHGGGSTVDDEEIRKFGAIGKGEIPVPIWLLSALSPFPILPLCIKYALVTLPPLWP